MNGDVMEKAGQAAAFFRNQPGFVRLFTALTQKYRSLGKMGGRVKLEQLKDEEVQAISSLFRINLKNRKEVSISFAQFAAALQETRFYDVDAVALLQAYHGGELITHQQQRTVARLARERFFAELRASVQEPLGLQWLSKVEAKEPGTKRSQAMYEQGQPDSAAAFRMILSALAGLPTEYLRLPFFAQRIAGQPHAFDGNTSLGRLFLEALRLLQRDTESNFGDESRAGITAVELEAELLYAYKLLRDDLLNFVTCTGLAGGNEEPGGRERAVYWRQAWEDAVVLNVPLREIVRYSFFVPANSHRERCEKKVFIVENSGVFSAIADYGVGRGCRLPALVCLHGQFKLASWAILDRLVAGGCTLYYSGDFDPEGLLMAERLIKRYPGAARLWRYSGDDYRRSLADNIAVRMAEAIDDSRLKQLDGLSISELCAVAALLQETKIAGYQEALLEQLVQDCLLDRVG